MVTLYSALLPHIKKVVDLNLDGNNSEVSKIFFLGTPVPSNSRNLHVRLIGNSKLTLSVCAQLFLLVGLAMDCWPVEGQLMKSMNGGL